MENNELTRTEHAPGAGVGVPYTSAFHAGMSHDELYREATLSILVPVYNERHTIWEIVRQVCSIEIRKEIIIVDDGSTDGTKEILREIETYFEGDGDSTNFVRVIYHDKNSGKGSAIHTAIKYVTGDVVIIQDADLEYDPTDYYQLVLPILQDKADVVFGSRFQGGGPHRVLYFWHAVGNRLITLFSNMFTNLNLTDVEAGYKAFRADVLPTLALREHDFGFEIEVASKVARRRLRVYEIGISYFGRTYSEGKKITWKDGLRALFLVLKYR